MAHAVLVNPEAMSPQELGLIPLPLRKNRCPLLSLLSTTNTILVCRNPPLRTVSFRLSVSLSLFNPFFSVVGTTYNRDTFFPNLLFP
jgi:hypothetical protein